MTISAQQQEIPLARYFCTFDRSSLQFTVKLLRPYNPSLALRIQNFIAPHVSDRVEMAQPPKPGDQVELQLDRSTLQVVVETLAEAGIDRAQQAITGLDPNHDELVQTEQVIDQWLRYAVQTIDAHRQRSEFREYT